MPYATGGATWDAVHAEIRQALRESFWAAPGGLSAAQRRRDVEQRLCRAGWRRGRDPGTLTTSHPGVETVIERTYLEAAIRQFAAVDICTRCHRPLDSAGPDPRRTDR